MQRSENQTCKRDRDKMPRPRTRSSSPGRLAMGLLEGFLRHPLGSILAQQVFDQFEPKDYINMYQDLRIMNNIFDEVTGNYDELFPNQYWRIIAKRFYDKDYVWSLVEDRIIEDFKKTDIHRLSIMAYAMTVC